MTDSDKTLIDNLEWFYYKYPNSFLASEELLAISGMCKVAADRLRELIEAQETEKYSNCERIVNKDKAD